MTFTNSYADTKRAEAYARLEFANTYYLAYRDLPEIIAGHVRGPRALDFGCGTGRSTRFVRQLGFEVVSVDIAPEMIEHARRLDSGGDYRLIANGDFSGLEPLSFDLVLSLFTFDNIPGMETKVNL
ncbi:MAG TPA: class I SAM-dependent methyltransferase, partial [Candidatus Angelobacter sp.]|nr:class I SAM-dependent methyltransferase [Candidatus Angelobacter sp.]